jgi:hypothetical protein
MIKLKHLLKEVSDSNPAKNFLIKYYSNWPTPEEHAKTIRKSRKNEKDPEKSFKDKNSLKRSLRMPDNAGVEIARENYYEAMKKFNDALKKHPLHVVEAGWGLDLKTAFESYHEAFSNYLAQFPEDVEFGMND